MLGVLILIRGDRVPGSLLELKVSLQAAPLHPLPSKIRSLFQAEAELVAMGPTFVAQPHLEEVRLVFLADGSKMSLLENETSPVTALAASRDLILVARDTSAIYDSSGRFMANIPFAGSAAALAHGPELLWAVLGTEREVQVWQLRGLEENSDAERIRSIGIFVAACLSVFGNGSFPTGAGFLAT
ncbi:unnamed protein product [Effrenium voratum]|nr:unnamed protein product [Effrenium voratum]